MNTVIRLFTGNKTSSKKTAKIYPEPTPQTKPRSKNLWMHPDDSLKITKGYTATMRAAQGKGTGSGGMGKTGGANPSKKTKKHTKKPVKK